ncbi:MAG TPA: hypothetical protein PLX77_03300 [Candidatus Cloacimonadota bacterium]|nr:hypothetical protein [Candidatus Cloacimonadota bacterium]
MPKIVFLCTRNRFRSPLAAAMLKHELSARKLPGEWIVESAGSWVYDLIPPTPEAFFEAEKRGLDISSHISLGIEALDLDSIDLLLVMEQGQKESILIDFPKLRNRIYLLSELSGPPFSIPDPYVTKEPSDVIAQEIETLIKDNVDNIIALAKTNKHS